MILSALLLSALLPAARAADTAVSASPAAPKSQGSIELSACYVAGANEKTALNALRCLSQFSEGHSAFRAEKFFQTKKEYSPTAGGCDVSIRVAGSEGGASAEAFSSRSGKFLFVERQETVAKDSCGELYSAVAARFRKDPELMAKVDGASAPKAETKTEAKPEEKPLPELPPQAETKPVELPSAAPAPAPPPAETPKP